MSFMEIIIRKDNKLIVISATYFENVTEIKAITHPLRIKILQELSKKPNYPKALSRKLKIQPQKMQYHFKILEKLGLVEKVKEEKISGAVANYYRVTKKAFLVNIFGKDLFENSKKVALPTIETPEWLKFFIDKGRFNGKIIVGSPDLHGPFSARSRDGWCAAELTLYIGRFVKKFGDNTIILDTAISSDALKENLILIGGPITNSITRRVNELMPMNFDLKGSNAIIDKKELKKYTEDNIGLVVLIDNPFSKDKKSKILVCAGKKIDGTRAAILAIVKYQNKIPNSENFSILVESLDRDSDGLIDDVRFIKVSSEAGIAKK